MRLFNLFFVAIFLGFFAIPVGAKPPLEAYGALPVLSSVAVSPDGEHVAFLQIDDGEEFLVVTKIGGGIIAAVNTSQLKTRSVSFAGRDHVLLRASETTRIFGFRGTLEYTAAFALNIKTKKIRQLLKGQEGLYPAQEGLGRIVAISGDGKHVYMPAYSGLTDNPPLDLYKIALSSGRGRGRRATRGISHTIDWVVGQDGTIFAREDYNNRSDKYELLTRVNGNYERIFIEEDTSRIPINVVGVVGDHSGLLVVDRDADENFSSVGKLDFTGQRETVFAREGAGVEKILVDINRRVIGAQFRGVFPTVEFFDKDLEADFSTVSQYFNLDSVRLTSWSDDLNSLIIFVSGSGSSGDFYLYRRNEKRLTKLGSARPEILPDEIGEIMSVEYPARDGLKINGLLTMPVANIEGPAPMIVMPHGGPESYDAVGFDWMAQYFANRGYLVFQPNFRGSLGFGAEYRNAGRGEWGRKMQDDITDGVNALISSGRADPGRICIVGGSYGGYAALAGGFKTPDLYKCIAAIAPVTDIPRMLAQERRERGSSHWVYDYWKTLAGDPRSSKAQLEEVSPVNQADRIKAPILLIHGKDDTIVPIAQSEAMERALKRSNKDVEFVKLKGEDHWLSTNEARLHTLKELDRFVKTHLGAHE